LHGERRAAVLEARGVDLKILNVFWRGRGLAVVQDRELEPVEERDRRLRVNRKHRVRRDDRVGVDGDDVVARRWERRRRLAAARRGEADECECGAKGLCDHRGAPLSGLGRGEA
jgi:hypothetical protein